MNEQQLIQIMNTIRDNASAEYQERIPEATKSNIQEIGGLMLEEVNFVNEFSSALMQKVAKTIFVTKYFKNPLKVLKKGNKPIGDTVEEILVNFAKSKPYNPEGTELLTQEKPDVKTVYHQMNRQDKYKVTITRPLLVKAFKSYDSLGRFISNIINSLWNGSELDEFVLFKKMIAEAVNKGHVKTIAVKDPVLGAENATEFIKTVKVISGDMVFPNTEYNGYLQAQDKDTNPIITFTPTEDQIIIISNPTNVALDVDVLAKAFNMDKMSFMARSIIIDAFPDANIRAMIVDTDWSQIYDDMIQVTEFMNADGLYHSYWLHVWQTIDYSCLVNAVALVVANDTNEDGAITEYTVTNNLKAGVTSTNASKTKVLEGASYSATLKNVTAGFDTVTVTMGGTDITATAYTEDTNKINITKVTGAIVITVA